MPPTGIGAGEGQPPDPRHRAYVPLNPQIAGMGFHLKSAPLIYALSQIVRNH